MDSSSLNYLDYIRGYERYDDLPEPTIVVTPRERPLVPPGQYLAKFIGHRTANPFDTPKVYLEFQICEAPYLETVIFRPYGVKQLKGKPGIKGGFHIGRGSDLAWDLRKIHGKKPIRRDRVSFRWMRHVLWEIKVSTVSVDYRQRMLPDEDKYSRIDSYTVVDGMDYVNKTFGLEIDRNMTLGARKQFPKRSVTKTLT